MIADDEELTRLSTVRILKEASTDIRKKINIVEAEDGLETIFIIYRSANLGIKINLIISDENMNFVNGIKSSLILRDILEKRRMKEVPFYLVSAYDSNFLNYSLSYKIKKFITKPITLDSAIKILKEN